VPSRLAGRPRRGVRLIFLGIGRLLNAKQTAWESAGVVSEGPRPTNWIGLARRVKRRSLFAGQGLTRIRSYLRVMERL